MLAPLYSREAEMAAIGCALQSPNALSLLCALDAEDFYFADNRQFAKAAARLRAEDKPVDVVTLHEQLIADGINDPKLAGHALDCMTSAPTSVNAPAYVERIRELSARRKILTIAETAAKAIADPMRETAAVVDDIRRSLRDLAVNRHAWMDMAALVNRTWNDIDNRASGKIKPIRTGLDDLDRVIGGLYPGELTIIGARPGVGKSAFAASVAVTAAFAGKKVCVCSREMIAEQYGQRLFSRLVGINGSRLRAADTLDESDWESIADMLPSMAKLPISFLFTVRTVEDLRAELQHRIDTEGADLLIVDYLQLMHTTQAYREDHLRVAHISKSLKEFTLDFGIPVIALAQLKRTGTRTLVEPTLEDLKDSGAIEQDADSVILLHRPENPEDPSVRPDDQVAMVSLAECGKQYMVLKIAKQRQGQTGKLAIVFDPEQMRYYGMAKHVESR